MRTSFPKKTSDSVAVEITNSSNMVLMRIRLNSSGASTSFISDNISLLGYSKKEFYKNNLSLFDIIHKNDLERVLSRFRYSNTTTITSEIYRIRNLHNEYIWVKDNVIMKSKGTKAYYDIILTFLPASEIHNTNEILAQILALTSSGDPEWVANSIFSVLGKKYCFDRIALIINKPGKKAEVLLDSIFCEDFPAGNLRPGLAYFYDKKIRMILEKSQYYACSSYSGKNAGAPAPLSLCIFSLDINGGAYFVIENYYNSLLIDKPFLLFLKNIAGILTLLLGQRGRIAENMNLSKDLLTLLPNRYQFREDLKGCISGCYAKNKTGYIFFIDLDDFKVINNYYGHHYGDALLIEVASFFKKEFSEQCKAYHFSGDEFILMAEDSEKIDIEQLLDTLMLRATKPWDVLDIQYYCTYSVGVQSFPYKDSGALDIIKNADLAMHQAKKLGKHNCVFYETYLDTDVTHRAKIEKMLYQSIQNNFEGFVLHYHLMVNKDGEVTGAEALLRWQLGTKTIMPDEFIPLAEYLGLINPLGDYVICNALTECKRINDTYPFFMMNINVSIYQLQNPAFFENFRETLNIVGVNACNIVLEVTETSIAKEINQIIDTLEALRKLGVLIAMDDFGTGYSSLNSMQKMPIDIIKIDAAFIQDLYSDNYSDHFIKLITDLTQSLNRKVCIEGVETEEQWLYCQNTNIDTIQGFYLAHPMSVTDLHSILSID